MIMRSRQLDPRRAARSDVNLQFAPPSQHAIIFATCSITMKKRACVSLQSLQLPICL